MGQDSAFAHPRSADAESSLPRAAGDLLSAVSDTPELDVRLLREAARDEAEFDSFIARRMRHEPVAYITGTRGFWTIDLDVAPGVLIPRPDSETLIDAAMRYFDGTPGPRRVLDLGTGSGALLLAALDQWPAATGIGVDASSEALTIARGNAARIAPGRAEMILGNWAEDITERFDLVLCNPPYVEDDAVLDPQVRDWEPHAALFGGADGLDAYRMLAPQIARTIARGGVACIEIGWTQADAVGVLLAAQGLRVTVRNDLGGRDRCLIAVPN